MSNYRDDIQETIVTSSFAFAKVVAGDVESMRITDQIYNTVINTFGDTVQLVDEFHGKRRIITEDTLVIADQVHDQVKSFHLISDLLKASAATTMLLNETIDDSCGIADQVQHTTGSIMLDQLQIVESLATQLTAFNLISDKAKATDGVSGRKIIKEVIEDSVLAQDASIENLLSLITETIQVTDLDLSRNKIKRDLTDKLKVSDSSPIKQREIVADSLVLSDQVKAVLTFKDMIADHLQIIDQAFDVPRSNQWIEDQIAISDASSGFKIAKGQINDTVFIDDEPFDNIQTAIAWSSGTDGWNMSRYSDFNYEQLAVINGELYGVTETGVECLHYGQAEVTAKIETAKLDLGVGQLVHPLEMFLEYLLSGENKSLSVDVGTTQTGRYTQYSYSLTKENSDELTNGRVLFGRGLRGRHFNFTLNLVGQAGYINDIDVNIAKTKRRI
ncbi:hypothetical protein ABVS_3055 [Acinetobacter lwoffii]|uniref:hypothetical protein n=1 Tax=Acinetobacter lwoffii TaxID=28090 RepID=UPI001C92F5A4|nr:hypothetical protein [Acinetobacter lwoffii]QZM13681.1 hypothetical protein ABVS_3055 [Acinetobacter lwoffii]